MIVKRHSRDNKRILDNALATSEASSLRVGNTGVKKAPSREATMRSVVTALFCLTIVIACLTLVLSSFLRNSLQPHDASKCDHICDDDICTIILIEQEGSENTRFATILRAITGVAPPKRSELSEDTIVRIVDTTPPTSNEPGRLPGNDQSGARYETNQGENGDVAGLHQDVTSNDDFDSDDADPGIIIDITDYSLPCERFATIDRDVPEDEWLAFLREPEGIKLTIVLEGEVGMAIISQNGHVLNTNPMLSQRSYVINRVVDGDTFIFAAGPENENHVVQWSAYLTSDSEQRFPLSIGTSDPPVSIRTFIMFDADITIVIEFVAVPTEPPSILVGHSR